MYVTRGIWVQNSYLYHFTWSSQALKQKSLFPWACCCLQLGCEWIQNTKIPHPPNGSWHRPQVPRKAHESLLHRLTVLSCQESFLLGSAASDRSRILKVSRSGFPGSAWGSKRKWLGNGGLPPSFPCAGRREPAHQKGSLVKVDTHALYLRIDYIVYGMKVKERDRETWNEPQPHRLEDWLYLWWHTGKPSNSAAIHEW